VIKYPKIETLFDRDKETFKVIETKLRQPEFGVIDRWTVTEKLDGTNVRVHLGADDRVTFGGRTDNAQMPTRLVQHLNEHFTVDQMTALRLDADKTEITLFGEGVGAGIQKGGNYTSEQVFVLFDVCIDNRVFLDDDQVTEIAAQLGINRAPIIAYSASIPFIVAYVRDGFMSNAAQEPMIAEGVVARPRVPLINRRGERVMWKLKTKDF
jgi:hypothetical protein